MSILHLYPVPRKTSKGRVLQWLVEHGNIKSKAVGRIAITGSLARIGVETNLGPRVTKFVHGQKFDNRTIEAWDSPSDTDYGGNDYFEKLLKLLEIEAEECTKLSSANLRQSQENHRDASSSSLTNLIVTGDDTGFGGQLYLTLAPKNQQRLPPTRIRVGSPVLLTEINQQVSRPGIVCRVARESVQIALTEDIPPSMDDTVFRLDLADDNIASQREQMAVTRVASASGNRLAELRDIIVGATQLQFSKGDDHFVSSPSLNQTQSDAVKFALTAQDIAIIHGPPGTGKTTVLVEIIREMVKRGQKVLACAPSNLAVDNLFEKLLDAGENVVRLGHPIRILPHLREFNLDGLAEKHDDAGFAKKLWKGASTLFRKADRMREKGKSKTEWKECQSEAREIAADAQKIEQQLVDSILDSATIICSTLHGVDAQFLGARRFDTAIIDEAGQCTEPAAWIPVLRSDRIILAGDHCQLPPTVISNEAIKRGFGLSLFEKLVARHGGEISKLLIDQYRMHKDIMGFSSAEFYDNSLVADDSVSDRLLKDFDGIQEEELTSTAVHFIDTSGAGYNDEQERGGTSFLNVNEAKLVIRKVDQLLELGVEPEQLAVLTPYAGQVRQISENISREDIEVTSIDGYQGRENEAIIISLVRSNKENEIGFLADTRRMNVALTRARRKLIVIGDSSTISTHPFYARLLEYFDEMGAYYGVWDE